MKSPPPSPRSFFFTQITAPPPTGGAPPRTECARAAVLSASRIASSVPASMNLSTFSLWSTIIAVIASTATWTSGPLAGWWRTADSRAAHAPIFATRVLVSSSTASFRTHAAPCNWMFTTVSWSRIAATTSPASPEDHTFDTGEDEVVDAEEGDNEEVDENDDGDDALLNVVVAMSRRHAMAHCWHTSAEPPCLFIAAATASTPPTRTTLSTFNGLL
mmetsp:Transcript_24585/g.66295  ORF Transcript_24585/g.66295 Transcript_24585/m.66295 type:complete len:217 (-) Transcript_24585:873-1523(-)